MEITMRHKAVEPMERSYSQACLVEAPKRWLFVSGQTPTDEADGRPRPSTTSAGWPGVTLSASSPPRAWAWTTW